MRQSFWRTCWRVTGIHLLLIAVLGSSACVRRWLRASPKEEVIPIEFMVALPPETALAVEDDVAAPPEPDSDIPEQDTIPDEPPPPPRPRRQPIETSRQRITRVTGDSPPERQPVLTPEQIERLLAEGARVGERTVVPGEDQRLLLRIQETLHAAWVEPSAAEAGGREAILTLRLDARGRIISGRITRPSGSDALDDSVNAIMSRVHEIPGITAAFVQRYPQVNVAFKVR